MKDIHIAGVDALVRGISLAFVRVHVLYHAADGPIYGAAMMEELARHDYQIGPGTVYPTLHALRRQGYLDEERRGVGGTRWRCCARSSGNWWGKC